MLINTLCWIGVLITGIGFYAYSNGHTAWGTTLWLLSADLYMAMELFLNGAAP